MTAARPNAGIPVDLLVRRMNDTQVVLRNLNAEESKARARANSLAAEANRVATDLFEIKAEINRRNR